jgi:crotonobetainyl-CoA:carnitine CoA-transferase CaiB-like acyl-CoA transferase
MTTATPDGHPTGRQTAMLPATTKVLELGESVATATAGRYLERLGARVTRVLPVGVRSELSDLGPMIGRGDSERSAVGEWLRHGKVLTELDLSRGLGRARLNELLGESDVVLVAGTSADWEALGVTVAHMREVASQAVIGHVTHWGDSGPYSNLCGSELLVQAAGGLMNLIGVLDREPVRLGGRAMQATAGLLALDGVMIGLFRRQNTGKGAYFTTSEFEAVAHVEWKIASQVQAGRRRELRGQDGGGPVVVRTLDGHFALFFTPRHWDQVKELIPDPRLHDAKFSDPPARAKPRSVELLAVAAWFVVIWVRG